MPSLPADGNNSVQPTAEASRNARATGLPTGTAHNGAESASTSAVQRRPVVIDLFSGAGGLSLGFESAGFDVVAAVEYDPVHAATHLFNFPLTDVLCRDVKTVTGDELRASAKRGWELHHPDQEWDGVIDVIVGGPSCQGFSRIGKQSEDDDRNQLVFEFVRLVEEVKPRAFCMENVQGFLDSRFDRLRAEALRRLRDAGYAISGHEKVLKAEEFGVPQKRRRVFVLGHLGDVAPVRPLATHTTAPTVGDAFAGLPDPQTYPRLLDSDVATLTKVDAAAITNAKNEYLILGGIRGDGSEAFGHPRIVDRTRLAGCKFTQHREVSITRFAATAQGSNEAVSRYYRLNEKEPALTLRAGTGTERGAFSAARPLHPTKPRVITVREAARLHSFPDWFRFHVTNWHGHRQIGNAVPPLLAAAAARSLLASLKLTPSKSTHAPLKLGAESLLSLNATEAAEELKAVANQLPGKRVREADVLAKRELAQQQEIAA